MERFQEADTTAFLDKLTKRREASGALPVTESYRCPECHDTGWIQAKHGDRTGVLQCRCAVEARVKRKLTELPIRYWNVSIDDTPSGEGQAAMIRQVRTNPATNFYFHGDYATGKTHALAIQFKELARAGKRCFFRTGDELIRELQNAVMENVAPSPVLESLSLALPGEFHLCWDDIDKVDWDRTPFRREAAGQLIDKIYRQKQGLSVTTNYSIDDWAAQQKMPQYVLSRIDRLCREHMIII